MEFKSKTSLSTLASASLLCLSASALAEGYHHNGAAVPAVSVTRLGAALSGTGNFAGTGSFEYSDSTHGGNLHARIHLPVDGVTIADSNAAVTYAANDLVTLTVSNGSTVLATYNLAIKDIDFTYSNATTISGESAEYAVSASQTGTTYTVNLGSSTSTALPTLAAGDTVSITLNGASKPILSGTLAASAGH